MPEYFYTAKSQKGEPLTGTKEAKDESELARILRKEGSILISVILKSKKKTKNIEINLSFFKGVSLKEKLMFTRNLQVMISAGIPLPRVLKTLASQSKSKNFKNALNGAANDIIKGDNFSNSLAKYPSIFSDLFCQMIKVGEETGALEENLSILAHQMEKDYDLRSKVKGAMMYPMVILIAMFGIGILMLMLVVPPMAETFKDLGVELPLMTRMVVDFGVFLAEKWHLFILIIIIFLYSLKTALKTKQGKKIFDYFILRVPIISSIVKKTNSAVMVRTLSSLTSSGVSLIKSLEIISGTLSNFYFKESVIKSINDIKKGGKLSEALSLYEYLYSSMVIQMIAVGEETGQTSEILQKLADFFEEEVTNITKNLSAIIEPVLMLFIGGAVGFFAISMIKPLHGILGAI